MDLLINDTVATFDRPTVQQVMDTIRTSIHKGEFYSYLIADGEEVHSDAETYLKQHLPHIQELKVIAQTLDDMVRDNLQTAHGYLDRALPLIEQLADRFYQNPSQTDWQSFADLLGGIEWIDDMLALIVKIDAEHENWRTLTDFRSPIKEQVVKMDTALKANDHVLTADILNYEIQPLFSQLNDAIVGVIGSEEQTS